MTRTDALLLGLLRGELGLEQALEEGGISGALLRRFACDCAEMAVAAGREQGLPIGPATAELPGLTLCWLRGGLEDPAWRDAAAQAWSEMERWEAERQRCEEQGTLPAVTEASYQIARAAAWAAEPPVAEAADMAAWAAAEALCALSPQGSLSWEPIRHQQRQHLAFLLQRQRDSRQRLLHLLLARARQRRDGIERWGQHLEEPLFGS